jgi:uncharacterized protein (DUF2147 family)
MKHLFVAIFVLSVFTGAYAQKAEDIAGIWLTKNDKGELSSQVQIWQASNGKIYGKIVWLFQPNENGKPKLDKNNPDEKARTRPLLGLQLLNHFVFEDKEWSGGKIYDPKNGKTYSCVMWFDGNDKNTLHVKGFIGVSLIGREVVWTREAKIR